MNLYWLDLETTGLDPRRDGILEVAVSVAELARPFEAKPVYHAVLPLPGWANGDRNKLEPYIQSMHGSTGLLDECERSILSVAEVERHLLVHVPKVDDKEDMPTLAGASIHFDHDFLKARMPTLAARFSHRHYDTSAVKLFCQSLGMPKLPRGEAHRAKDDVLEAIAHAKHCYFWLLKWGVRYAKQLPPEALAPDASEIIDLDGEAYIRWLETGEGQDPTTFVPVSP